MAKEEKERQRGGTAASRPFANSCHLAQVATQKIRKRSSNNNSYTHTHRQTEQIDSDRSQEMAAVHNSRIYQISDLVAVLYRFISLCE